MPWSDPTLNARGDFHGMVPPLPDDPALFLDGNGEWTIPSGTAQAYTNEGNSGSAATISIASATVVQYTLSANCTFTFPVVNTGAWYQFVLMLTQDASGNRLVTWPASVDWGAQGSPTLSTGTTKTDVIVFFTVNGGTTWMGAVVGLGF